MEVRSQNAEVKIYGDLLLHSDFSLLTWFLNSHGRSGKFVTGAAVCSPRTSAGGGLPLVCGAGGASAGHCRMGAEQLRRQRGSAGHGDARTVVWIPVKAARRAAGGTRGWRRRIGSQAGGRPENISH